MSNINDLINQMCPNGCEYKSLDEISDRIKGMTGVSNKWADEGNCQFIDYLNVYNHLKVDISLRPFATVKKQEQTSLKIGDILITSASETPDECALSAVIEDDIEDNTFLDDHLFGIRINDEYANSVNPSYVNYYFHSREFRRILPKAVRGVTRYYVSLPEFMELEIPVPPLPVQEEIVRILDKFTELEQELEQELELRKKQYEYYRDKMLSLSDYDGEVEEVSVDDLLIRHDVLTVTPKFKVKKGAYQSDGLTPIISQEEDYISGYIDLVDEKLPQGEYVCFGDHSEHIKYIDFAFVQGADGLKIMKTNSTCILPKYFYYAICNNYVRQNNYARHFSILRNVVIKIPDITEQKRIVDVLDKFSTLTSDISEGLPAEIKMRKQQYSYFRDKLLSFRRLSAS